MSRIPQKNSKPAGPLTDTGTHTGAVVILTMVCFVALACPFLFGYGTLPLTNFAGEIVSLAGFGALLLMVARYGAFSELTASVKWAEVALALLLSALFLQYFYFDRTDVMVWLTTAGYLLAAMLAVWAGASARAGPFAPYWHNGIAIAVLAGSLLASLASAAQYLSVDASWLVLSPAAESGRTFGFVRQPNHQATFLSIGLAALCCLQTQTSRVWGRALYLVAAPLLVFGIVSTGSRTGLVQLLVLSLATTYFCRKHKCGPWKGAYTLVLAAVMWTVLYVLAQYGVFDFYGANKLVQTGSEGIGVRSAVWRETWHLILERPWAGWGLPSFGSVFYLSGAAEKAGIVMTHSHNLFLQIAFAFGLPVGLCFFAVMGSVIYSLRGQVFTPQGFFCAVLLGCLFIHSQIEFPLWYTYFLLPASYSLGWLASNALPAVTDIYAMLSASENSKHRLRQSAGKTLAASFGLILISSAVWINRDYYRITPVFSPGLSADLDDRLATARSVTWLREYPAYLSLLRTKVSANNYQAYLSAASTSGCQLYEIWYQPVTILALTYAGKIAEAKWIMYSYWRLSGGMIAQFKPPLLQSDAGRAAEMLAFLENPQPVDRSTATFDSSCYAR